MDMHNSFWIGFKLNDFLFKGLDVNTIPGIYLSIDFSNTNI